MFSMSFDQPETNAIHSKLLYETEKIFQYKTSADLALNEKDKLIEEHEQTITTLRSNLLELQVFNEELSHDLLKNKTENEQISNRWEAVETMCNIVKNRQDTLYVTVNEYDAVRELMRMRDEEQQDEIKALYSDVFNWKEKHLQDVNKMKNKHESEFKEATETLVKYKNAMSAENLRRLDLEAEIEFLTDFMTTTSLELYKSEEKFSELLAEKNWLIIEREQESERKNKKITEMAKQHAEIENNLTALIADNKKEILSCREYMDQVTAEKYRLEELTKSLESEIKEKGVKYEAEIDKNNKQEEEISDLKLEVLYVKNLSKENLEEELKKSKKEYEEKMKVFEENYKNEIEKINKMLDSEKAKFEEMVKENELKSKEANSKYDELLNAVQKELEIVKNSYEEEKEHSEQEKRKNNDLEENSNKNEEKHQEEIKKLESSLKEIKEEKDALKQKIKAGMGKLKTGEKTLNQEIKKNKKLQIKNQNLEKKLKEKISETKADLKNKENETEELIKQNEEKIKEVEKDCSKKVSEMMELAETWKNENEQIVVEKNGEIEVLKDQLDKTTTTLAEKLHDLDDIKNSFSKQEQEFNDLKKKIKDLTSSPKKSHARDTYAPHLFGDSYAIPQFGNPGSSKSLSILKGRKEPMAAPTIMKSNKRSLITPTKNVSFNSPLCKFNQESDSSDGYNVEIPSDEDRFDTVRRSAQSPHVRMAHISPSPRVSTSSNELFPVNRRPPLSHCATPRPLASKRPKFDRETLRTYISPKKINLELSGSKKPEAEKENSKPEKGIFDSLL